jgi:flagellar M-ring protein FliF
MEQLRSLIASLSVRQRWTIIATALLVAAGLYGLSRWERESAFRPLYNGMAPEDAALVVQKIKEGGTEYRLSNNGTTISVPDDRVAELRLELASAGIPKSGRIGFEIFDKTNFGMTDFAEHINYRRALEGELERSVMAITEVEQARVHISFPQESVYSEARQPAKASVLIKTRPGAALPESAVPAITHLVASAVEGLAAESVSLLDMRGNLLSRPKRTGNSAEESSSVALEYRQSIEHDLNAKLNSTLEPLLGAGRFRTAVSAECDLTSAEQNEESFDPTRAVMASSQRTEDSSTPTRASTGVLGTASGGIPGTASNLPESSPPPPPAAVSGGTSRKTENVNYQTSRTVKRTILPQGGIKRLSVSVLLDQDLHWEGTGSTAKRVLVPPSPERLKVIHDLVAAAIGLNVDRGDQLIVESLPFESTLNLDPPVAPGPVSTKKQSPLEQLKSDPKLVGGLVAILLVVLFGAFFVLSRGRKGPVHKPVRVNTAQLPSPTGDAAGTLAAAGQAALAAVNSAVEKVVIAPGKNETLAASLREGSTKDPEGYVNILRGWLNEGRP